MARVYEGRPVFWDRLARPVERLVYRCCGISPEAEMDWKGYALAVLVANALGMGLKTPQSAILSAVIFNALIIVCLIPLALKGVRYRAVGAARALRDNLLLYGLGGLVTPFLGIKAIDMVGDREAHLTPIEFKLLAVMARHAGKVVTQAQLLREVWGKAATEQGHYVRVYVHQLRHKIELEPARPVHLKTETGVGYRLE